MKIITFLHSFRRPYVVIIIIIRNGINAYGKPIVSYLVPMLRRQINSNFPFFEFVNIKNDVGI